MGNRKVMGQFFYTPIDERISNEKYNIEILTHPIYTKASAIMDGSIEAVTSNSRGMSDKKGGSEILISTKGSFSGLTAEDLEKAGAVFPGDFLSDADILAEEISSVIIHELAHLLGLFHMQEKGAKKIDGNTYRQLSSVVKAYLKAKKQLNPNLLLSSGKDIEAVSTNYMILGDRKGMNALNMYEDVVEYHFTKDQIRAMYNFIINGSKPFYNHSINKKSKESKSEVDPKKQKSPRFF